MRERRRSVCIKCILSVDKKKINLHLRFTVTSNNTDVGCAYEKDRKKRKGTYTRPVQKWRIESGRRDRRIGLRSRGKTNSRPSYEFSHPSRPPIFRLSVSVPFYGAPPVSSPPSIVPDRSARNWGHLARRNGQRNCRGCFRRLKVHAHISVPCQFRSGAVPACQW